ncbi:MAG: NAD(P)H-dependent oxidoreductase subunit E [Negativicutes bacterium]|nr:NAD(P)H-dependent oxidoreductase subunit E [Negativicutes bacterium]
MITISICIGSACHVKGAHAVLEALKGLIDKYHVSANIVLEGNFCQGRCTEGVVIKINDEIITNVSKEKVYAIFAAKVLGRCDQ